MAEPIDNRISVVVLVERACTGEQLISETFQTHLDYAGDGALEDEEVADLLESIIFQYRHQRGRYPQSAGPLPSPTMEELFTNG